MSVRLQLIFSQEEDRLLLRFAEGESAKGYWLTRRMTILLWQVLVKMLSAEVLCSATAREAQDWLLHIRHDDAAARLPTTVEPEIILPEPPILVTTLRHGQQDDGRWLLGLYGADEAGALYAIAEDILHALAKLIKLRVEAEAEWGLDLQLTDHAAADLAMVNTLHH